MNGSEKKQQSNKGQLSIKSPVSDKKQVPDKKQMSDKKQVPDKKQMSGKKQVAEIKQIPDKRQISDKKPISDKEKMSVRIRNFLKNKYAVGSMILLTVIIVLVSIALNPPAPKEEKMEEVGESEVIYIIDELGNKVPVNSTEDDSIIMQNQKEIEDPTVLAYNPDTREGYMNNCVFLGDSRTVAMVSYGLISDANALAKVGISHWQVDSTVFVQNSGAQFTLKDYLKAHSEPVIYVCYGVNGMNGLDEEKYKQTYTELVDKIISLAGDRKIVLMSIWPVDDNGSYKGSVKNEWVDKYNAFLFDMAKEKGLYYLNIASILKDENGSIKKEYDSGDGLHYKSGAYKDILDYIIHHPVPGISDEGEFVVHYVKPRGEYKDIMTEMPTLPENIQLENDDYTFVIPEFPQGTLPVTDPSQVNEGENPEQEAQEQQEGWQEDNREEPNYGETYEEDHPEEHPEEHREEYHEEEQYYEENPDREW